MPTVSATARAPSSSPTASAGETAVTASARSPSARAASAATSDESTPPEKATIALPSLAIRRSIRLSSSRAGSGGVELSLPPPVLDPRKSRRPPGLGGPAGPGRDRRAVVVLGSDVDRLSIEPADLDPHPLARDL